MQINCYKCDSPLAAGDVNIQQAIAKCGNCQAVFRLDAEQRKRDRDPVDKPARFAIHHIGSETLIKYRWSMLVGLLLIGFSVFWNGITWTILTLMYLDGQVEWFLLLFMTPFVLVGLGTAFVAVMHLVNSTTIRATPNILSVTHGPLPWFGNRSIDPAHIDQFSSQERIHRDKDGTSTTYELVAHMIGGETIKLATGLEKPNHALYLEQQLEAALAIDDRPIPGEITH